MKRSNIFLIFLFCLPLLTSCTGNGKTVNQTIGYPISNDYTASTDESINEGNYAYPGGESKNNETMELPDDINIPTPSQQTAVIYGTLLSLSQDSSPYIAPSLFLGNILTSEDNNNIFLGSVSIESDPMAQQASNGKFVFTDIQPGKYGLFIWTPVSAFIVKNETDAQSVIIDVEPGEIYNLGTIYMP